MFDYEGVIIVCDEGSVDGTTGLDSDVVDLELGFSGDCGVNGLPMSDVNCSGTARLHFLDIDDGEIDRLNPGFLCEFVVPDVCTFAIAEQELPIPGGVNRADPIEGGIDVEVDLFATSDNPAFCGPESGVATWTGRYVGMSYTLEATQK
jgi:hypothetical protein